MDAPGEVAQRFFGYPQPIEGPHVPYQKKDDVNPIFSGTLLVVGAWMSVHLPFLHRNIS
jgi:hypothetical protein